MQKMSSFSSDFQTVIKHYFLLYFLYESLMSLRNIDQVLAAGNQVSMKWIDSYLPHLSNSVFH